MKLPFQCLQALVGVVVAWVLYHPMRLDQHFHNAVKRIK